MSTIVATHPRTAEPLFDFVQIKTRRFLAVTGHFRRGRGARRHAPVAVARDPACMGCWPRATSFLMSDSSSVSSRPPCWLCSRRLAPDDHRHHRVYPKNSLFTSLLPPYVVGDGRERRSPSPYFGGVLGFWVLGHLGAVLAILLTLLMKSVFIDADRAAWAATLIGSTRSEARRSLRRTRSTKDRSRDHA